MQKRKNKHTIEELFILEEHFQDQLRFKLISLFDLLAIQQKNRNEIISFLKELESTASENIEILSKYVTR